MRTTLKPRPKFIVLRSLAILAAALLFWLWQRPGRAIAGLPPPTLACRQPELSWHGLVAGRSTRAAVEQQLGAPAEEMVSQQWGFTARMYGYPVESPLLERLPEIKHRIYFTGDDIIDWMEIVIADSDGRFHTVNEYAERFGAEVDYVYQNNNFEYGFMDVQELPENIYVWSECGVALNAFPLWAMEEQQIDVGSVATHQPSATPPEITVRQPENLSSVRTRPDGSDIAMMLYLFPATTSTGYWTYYDKVIPFDRWHYFWNERNLYPTPVY